MAKGKTVLIRLVSMAGTGYSYTSTKNPVNIQRKLLLRKYDPVLGTHTYFREERISRRRIVQGK